MHKYIVNSAIQLILTGHPQHIHANTHTRAEREGERDTGTHKTTTNRMRSIYPSFDSFMFIWFIRSVVRTVGRPLARSVVRSFVRLAVR